MFEKLSSALKKATDKIANAIFLDKNLVEGIIKDLQRALIEADVNVQLVKKLSDELRKTAYDERIRGVEKKEHIIKLLHDKLLEILGGEQHDLKLEKGKNIKIMLLGLYGAGKCVHGKSKIQLSDGNIIQIKKIYEKYKDKLPEGILEDGSIIDISNENVLVPSFNPQTCKIENKKATHLWKLKKKELIQVNLDNGNDFSIKVTPEHPFFVLRNGQVTKIRAEEITDSDFIAIPREIKTEGKTINLSEKIKNLHVFVYLDKDEVKKLILGKKQTIKEITKNLKNKLNYCHLTLGLKKGKIPIELVSLEKSNQIRVKLHRADKIITLPLFLNSDLAEFLGYLIGDGHIGKNYTEIVSEDEEIISRVAELSKILFSITPSIKKDIRTRNLHRIILSSSTLVEFLGIFNLKPGKKGKELRIPKELLLSNQEIIRSFIKAYFDCDSSPAKNRRSIELSSESQVLIKQMQMLLLRFGIISTISRKIINDIPYWRLIIKSRYAELYSEKIGYLINHKRKKVEKYKTIGILEGCGDQDMIPLGKTLQELRNQKGFSIGEIQANAVYSYGRYEEKGFISREKLVKLIAYYNLKKSGIFANLLEGISNNTPLKEKYSRSFINGSFNYLKSQDIIRNEDNKIVLTNNGKLFLQKIKETNSKEQLINFENLALSDVCWLPIKEVKKIENDEDYVYDLTVEENHSFIAEGVIVHNTTTISKLAAYYGKRGYKTAALGLDVHRPAAREQLEQLGQKNKFQVFIDKEENNPIKTWKKFSSELKKFDLIFIDTAGRDALDKALVEEIKKLGRVIAPDYTILVMPADIGQAAKKQASEFQKALSINGVIITRMDSTAKGGGALTACKETGAPVYFITTGEHVNDIETFSPSSFLSRMLGMGDLQSLIEKVSSVVDEKKQLKLQERLKEGKFTMLDLLEQLKSMEGMGSFSKLKDLIPGLGNAKIPENMLESQEEKIKKWKFAISSMTKEEIENPEIIEKQTSRISRIAKGSGTNTSDVRALLKQYKMIHEFIKSGDMSGMEQGQLSQKQMMKLAKKFGRKIRM